ncbi:hypothetical protein ACFRCQ_25580 [Cytobacillus firmus]|uniref:hypothetical protein n=1 Tax=Cytobacillus firmus TaxID=1399 RepID=UPI0036B6EF6B
MSLNALIINTLSPLGVLVRFHQLLEEDGDPDTYITFFEYNQRGQLYGDDKELKTSHSIQVDVWSTGNYTDLVKQVKEKLILVGFTRTFETEIYESETDTFHKVIRFNFVQ